MNELKIVLPPTTPDSFQWDTLISILPAVLWIILACALFFWIGRDQIRLALLRVNKLGVGGLEVSFRDDLSTAAMARNSTITAPQLNRASRRLAGSNAITNGARVLWVDDDQTLIRNEVKLLEETGIRVERVKSSKTALQLISENVYDLVISDIDRDGDKTAGLKMAEANSLTDQDLLLIFYVGLAEKPTPPTAFGITDRPDELVHLILDALGRRRS